MTEVPGPSPAAHTLGDTTPAPASPDHADHLAALVRARRFAFVATLAWTGSFELDVIAAERFAPGSLAALLALRLAGTVVILSTWLRLRSPPTPSPRALRAVLAAAFTLVNVLFGVMGAVAGGLETPYVGGALVTLGAYGLLMHAPWRRGLADAAGVALAFPVTVLAAALFSPAIAAQLSDPRARGVFTFDLNNVAVMYGIVVVTGNMTWALKRQVFEARSVGRYKLKSRLGAGGMGEVWAAYHHGLKRDVAVKILRADAIRGSTAAVARFEREVRATAELSHPNTIRVFDYGVTDDGLCYYVMELLEGETVGSLVRRTGALPSPRALHLVSQAARALAEAHGRGIVHRDVKPENLLVAAAGGEPDFLKVLDFGIVKLAAEREDVSLTQTGWVLGTPQWLAPEAFAGKQVGPAADVYALGAVLYLLLAGQPPFTAASLAGYAEAHVHQTAPPLPDAVPADVRAIVARCLEKDPAARYATARELAEALATCADAGRWSILDLDTATQVVTVGRASRVDAMGETQAGQPASARTSRGY